MRSLVQISHPAVLPIAAAHVTHRHTSICRKQQHFHHHTQHRNSRIIGSQAASVVRLEASALSRYEPSEKSDHNAIGISRFLEGKNYLITGATGFLAKAFMEKLLRKIPEVGKIFVMIRAKSKEEAKRRLYSDIIESDVFETLIQMYGIKSYEAFMERKLVAVTGDIGEDNLGMDSEIIDKLAREIDIIINSAALTSTDERYDVALNINTQGTARLLNFARKCKNLSLFLQFSTAYANGKRGGNITEPVSIPMLDVKREIELAQTTAQSCSHDKITPKLKELGQERANVHGWQNSYNMTKAMGDMLINSNGGDLPVVILRPSMIESAYKEPYPGWIQGNRVLDPFISLYGKGELPGFAFDPQVIVDVVPLDKVVNTAMAAMAKHGQAGKAELNVYHVTSSSNNPLSLEQMFDYCYDYFMRYPLKDSRGQEIKIQKMVALKSVEDFSAYIHEFIANQDTISNGKSRSMLDKRQKRRAEYFVKVAKIYQPYFFYNGRFDNTNSRNLIDEMSEEEKVMFDFDIQRLDWKNYFTNVHVPGVVKHIMKGRS